MTHTPGPWSYYEPLPTAGSYPLVSRGGEGGFVVRGMSREREISDALLIAAAPDLLEELVRMANDMDSLGYDVSSARAVIAKATHKPQEG